MLIKMLKMYIRITERYIPKVTVIDGKILRDFFFIFYFINIL